MTLKNDVVAIDSGCAYVKMAWWADDQLKTAQIPAQAARGFAPVGLSGAAATYVVDGEEWHLSADKAENTQFASYPYSSHNLSLNLAGLASQGFSGDLKLATGVPVRDFYTETGPNQKNIERKKAALSKDYDLHGGELGFSLSCYKVCPEAVASVVDFVCDNDGSEKNAISGSLAVVDIGGRTTDLSIVDSNFMANSGSIKTLKLGCLDLYGALEKAIRDKFDVHSSIPVGMLEEASRTGQIQLYAGQDSLNIKDVVAQEKRKLAGRIQEEVERVFGDQHLTLTLYSGGGAAMFQEQLKEMSGQGVVVADDPQFSNVRGYWKIAQFLTQD